MTSKKSTLFLLFSVFVWLYVQYHLARHTVDDRHPKDLYKGMTPAQKQMAYHERKIASLRKQREQSALAALGNAAGQLFHRRQKDAPYADGNSNRHNKRPSHDGYTTATDRLPPNCTPIDWNNFNFPNCNDVHDIDLGEVLNYQRRGEVIPMDLGEGDVSEKRVSKEDKERALDMGYVGSGLWRQVWKVQPRLKKEDTVLKVMKREHPVNPRNFDRHRRDALVMERLAASPYVVSIYGFCGNTVLTEYAGSTLDDFVYSDDDHDEETSKNGTNIGAIAKEDPQLDISQRVNLAIDVMKGLQAMHDMGMVHADVQAKQFLLDPEKEGHVKINDFNRCRFLPKHDETGQSCKIKIPSAPGGWRSPEEYEMEKIDGKIDVFSAGYILFGILTSMKPWDSVMRNDVRRNVMKGKKPEIPEKFWKEGTAERAFAEVVDHLFEFHAKDRWSASRVIEELEKIKR